MCIRDSTKGHCVISDMFHLEAIKLISQSLRGAVQNTPEGREGMALGLSLIHISRSCRSCGRSPPLSATAPAAAAGPQMCIRDRCRREGVTGQSRTPSLLFSQSCAFSSSDKKDAAPPGRCGGLTPGTLFLSLIHISLWRGTLFPAGRAAGEVTVKLPRSSGPFVEDFAQNGRKCRQGIM